MQPKTLNIATMKLHLRVYTEPNGFNLKYIAFMYIYHLVMCFLTSPATRLFTEILSFL